MNLAMKRGTQLAPVITSVFQTKSNVSRKEMSKGGSSDIEHDSSMNSDTITLYSKILHIVKVRIA